MKHLLLLALLFLSSCARPEGVMVDPAFKPYLKRFQEVAVEQGLEMAAIGVNSVSVQFEADTSDKFKSGGIIGYCSVKDVKGHPYIAIKSGYWNHPLRTVEEKERLMFHELGHCVLRRGHDNEYITARDNGYPIPKSVMNSQDFNKNFYRANYEDYIRELFLKPASAERSAMGPSQFPASAYEDMHE